MKLGAEGKQLIERWEGRRSAAYLDTAGHWTTGIGHLIAPGESWMMNATLSGAQIDELFAKDVAWAESAVSRTFPGIKRQNQFDALVSFTYNLGETAVKNGSLAKLINDGATAETISAKWLEYVRAGGQVSQGLLNRRRAELALYWSHLWKAALGAMAIVAVLLVSAAIAITA